MISCASLFKSNLGLLLINGCDPNIYSGDNSLCHTVFKCAQIQCS